MTTHLYSSTVICIVAHYAESPVAITSLTEIGLLNIGIPRVESATFGAGLSSALSSSTPSNFPAPSTSTTCIWTVTDEEGMRPSYVRRSAEIIKHAPWGKAWKMREELASKHKLH